MKKNRKYLKIYLWRYLHRLTTKTVWCATTYEKHKFNKILIKEALENSGTLLFVDLQTHTGLFGICSNFTAIKFLRVTKDSII